MQYYNNVVYEYTYFLDSSHKYQHILKFCSISAILPFLTFPTL